MAGCEGEMDLSRGHFTRVGNEYMFDGTFRQDSTLGELAEAGRQTDVIRTLRATNPELVDAGFYETVKETGTVVVFGASSELWVPTCDAAREITVQSIVQHIPGATAAIKHHTFSIYPPK